MNRIKKNLEYFISNFGPEEGTKKFEQQKLRNREKSAWCIEYYLIQGISEIDGRKRISDIQCRSKDRFIKKYGQEEGEIRYNQYIKNNSSSLQNAIKKYGQEEGKYRHEQFISKSRRSLENFIKRYGQQEGQKRYKESLDKWQNSLNNKTDEEKSRINSKKAITLPNFIVKYGEEQGKIRYEHYISSRQFGRSKMSQKLFWLLFKQLKLDKNETYFSELNHEYYINDIIQKKFYFLDFVHKKKCIEFNGDRWHANPNKYKAKDCPAPFGEIKKTSKQIWEQDEQKYQSIRNRGFEILVVWQNEFIKQQNEIVKKCIDFLTKEQI